jgi:hypothetical protein
MRLGFRTSARKGENGFMQGRIVSSQAARRNIRGQIVNIFNVRKMPLISGGQKFARDKIAGIYAFSPVGENR